jgi:hypothetical protein
MIKYIQYLNDLDNVIISNKLRLSNMKRLLSIEIDNNSNKDYSKRFDEIYKLESTINYFEEELRNPVIYNLKKLKSFVEKKLNITI